MKEFTITVVSDKQADNPFDNLDMQPAGPVIPGQGERKTGKITNITLTAHLVDVEYSEAQVLLEKMKEDAKKA